MDYRTETVAIAGGGVMGIGIAEACARAGYLVRVAERDHAAAGQARASLERSLTRAMSRGGLSAGEAGRIAERIVIGDGIDSLVGAAIAIEAVPEVAGLKRPVLRQLDASLPGARFIATNTSSIPIGSLAAGMERPGLLVGVHFANPVATSLVVEVIGSLRTDPDALSAASTFVAEGLGRSVILAPDRPGFVVNALYIPFLLAAIRMAESGVPADVIDQAITMACRMPLGPLATADLIGLDVVRNIADAIYAETRDPAAIAPSLLVRMIEAGRLGRKTGRGFHDYPAEVTASA